MIKPCLKEIMKLILMLKRKFNFEFSFYFWLDNKHKEKL